MRRSIALLFVLIFLIAPSIVTFSPVKGEPKTIAVPVDYATIQEAVNAAQAGDTVFVHTGIYYELLVLNKSISLVGENKDTTIIDGNNIFGNVIEIVDNNVTIANLTIQKALGYPYYERHGIYIEGNSSGATIRNNTIKDNYGCGIYQERWLFSWLSEASNTTIVENNILNNFITAVTIRRGDNNTISPNKIENNSFGIYLDDSAYNVVSENSINGTSYNFGIEIDGSNNLIFRNNITNTYYGINESGSYNTVSENNITDSENGICITDAGHSTFNRNNVTHNYNGFNIWSRYNIIHENNIEHNNNGVVLWDGTVSPGPAIDNTFFHNNFVNNTVQVSFQASEDDENFWDNGAEGNFWSDYTGADNNNDGIGDTPFILSESNRDRYPLMSPLGDPSSVVPEFPSSIILPIFTITTLLMALAYFKKCKH